MSSTLLKIKIIVKRILKGKESVFDVAEIQAVHDKIKLIEDDTERITAFKTEIWQTESISGSFIQGTNESVRGAAYIMNKQVNDYFLEKCTRGDTVLDIGSGHGVVSEYLAMNGMKVTAVDVSEALLEAFSKRISRKNLAIKIKTGDAYNIPCENEEFDKVVARMFLPHFADWPVVLKEMVRVTKKGGNLLVHFSSKENSRLASQLGIRDCAFGTSPETIDPAKFYAETDDKELSTICASLGLEVVDRTPVSFFLHNRIFGNQVGQELYDQFQREMELKLSDEKIKDFVLWFDRIITANSVPALSHFNIISFKKL